MAAYAELEIGLERREPGVYAVALRFEDPESEAVHRATAGTVSFDFDRLSALSLDPQAYGALLGASLFEDPTVKGTFAKALGLVEGREMGLRLRLFVDLGAPELHSLRWESLRQPHDGAPLATNENILFSRYLSSTDWRPVRLRAQRDLRALVVIANPANLRNYGLAPLDVGAELARARAGLGTMAHSALASGGSATLDNLVAAARDGIDVLYLVCHGTLQAGEAWLWLEDEQGALARVAGSEVATRLTELPDQPRLVVLASCHSAGSGAEARPGDEGALAAAGPRLAETGIPAVVAMQGSVTIETVAAFMPIFFKELQRDGRIDRAMAVARGVVRERADWWMPVLFSRLKKVRIWYVPGFAGKEPFKQWKALTNNLRQGRCTPILGPGLLEPLFGSRREIARRLAEVHEFPLAPHSQVDLPQVAQFLAVNQDP
ncbi:MAG TPA: CHAT domain-containing protein, partial [Ardenticatenaceae bacterium]|nr:CHAT domain-containing protein [Ardenticatenaceae bacterium]